MLGPIPHWTSTGACAGSSGWTCVHGIGGTIEKTVCEFRFSSRGVCGTCCQIMQPEDATSVASRVRRGR